jgi:hypothetical protein
MHSKPPVFNRPVRNAYEFYLKALTNAQAMAFARHDAEKNGWAFSDLENRPLFIKFKMSVIKTMKSHRKKILNGR